MTGSCADRVDRPAAVTTRRASCDQTSQGSARQRTQRSTGDSDSTQRRSNNSEHARSAAHACDRRHGQLHGHHEHEHGDHEHEQRATEREHGDGTSASATASTSTSRTTFVGPPPATLPPSTSATPVSTSATSTAATPVSTSATSTSATPVSTADATG